MSQIVVSNEEKKNEKSSYTSTTGKRIEPRGQSPAKKATWSVTCHKRGGMLMLPWFKRREMHDYFLKADFYEDWLLAMCKNVKWGRV